MAVREILEIGHPLLAERAAEVDPDAIGSAEVQGLRRFLALAAQHGVIESAPELHFSFERVTDCHRAATLGPAVRSLEASDEVPHA